MFSQLKIILAVAFTVITWGSALVGIRAAIHDYSPGSLALFRYLFASSVMLIWCIKIGKWHRPSLSETIKIFLIGIAGFAIYNIALNYGEITVNAGVASFILSQIPVFIVILASFFLHEKINKLGWSGICVSLLGISIIAISEIQGIDFNIGIFALLVAALMGAIYSVGQKSLLKKFAPIELTAYAIWGGTIGLLIYLPQLITEIPKASTTATWSAIYLGIFPGALGYVCWSYVLMRIPASRASTFLYLLPMVAIILGWILLDDKPTFWSVIGGLIALLGAVIVNSKNTQSTTIKKPINTNLQNV